MIAFFLAVGLCTGLLGPATGSSFSFSGSVGAGPGTGGKALVAFRWDDVEGACCVLGSAEAGWNPGTGGLCGSSMVYMQLIMTIDDSSK